MHESEVRGKFWNDESVPGIGFPLVRRGYDPGRVDDYVTMTQAEMARLTDESRELHATIAHLERRLAASSRTATNPLDAWGMNVDKLIDGARADIDQIRNAASAEAQRLTEAAQVEAEHIVGAANDRAEKIDQGSTKRHERAQRGAAKERQLADDAVASAQRQLSQMLTLVDDVNARWSGHDN
jgi:cell division septum initiation protein DivIVA